MAGLTIQALPTGTQIGVYEIKDVICSDWNSILYRAWNEHLNTDVILKEYLPCDYAKRDADGKTVVVKSSADDSTFKYGIERFLELAEQLADIQHANIVSVHNVLQFNGTVYMAMDFVHGTPLSKIEGSSLSFSDEKSTQILQALLNGLRIFHKKNNVHGNINPSNIILSVNGEPVLVNFASANIAFSEYIKQQESTEEFNPAKNYHHGSLSNFSSDLYALGASLFFCLTGNDPAPIIERQSALNKNQPDPCQTALEKVKTESNELLLKTIQWMLNVNPQQRPQLAQEVLNKLEEESLEFDKNKYSGLPHTELLLPALGITASIALLAGTIWFFIAPEGMSIASNGETKETLVIETQRVGDVSNSLSSGSEISIETVVSSQVIDSIDKQDETLVRTVSSSNPVDLTELEKQELSNTTNHKEIAMLDSASIEKPETSQPDKYEKPISTTNIEISSLDATSVQTDFLVDDTNLGQEKNQLEQGQNKNEQISQYLAAAKKNVELFNFTTPFDNNAYDQYQAVLSIDKENADAIKGLQEMVTIYTVFIEKAIKEGDYGKAHLYIKRAEAIQADTQEIDHLRKELRKQRKLQRENVFSQGAVA